MRYRGFDRALPTNVTLSQKYRPRWDIIYLGGDDMKRKAIVNTELCVACGCCVKVCPKSAISVPNGIFAVVDSALCVGCGKCAKECPASVIEIGGGAE